MNNRPAPTREQLLAIAATVEERTGWDFSQMRTQRDPVPWDYLDVVPRYLQSSDVVLDIGTGGGEKLLAFAPGFARGVGIDPDPEMIRTARKNGAGQPRVTFLDMSAENLQFPDDSFDVVLNRHAPFTVAEVARVLKPGGYFVTQQVGSDNMANIRAEFNPGNPADDGERVQKSIAQFSQLHCRIVATGSYNVGYRMMDLSSLLFWFQAIAGANEVPAGYAIERDWPTVSRIIERFGDGDGVLTNEHRTLLIVRKGEAA